MVSRQLPQVPRLLPQKTTHMTPAEFRAKWTGHELKESAASREHFIDLCRMLDHPTPAEADPTGESFTFERGVDKVAGGQGFADVWKQGHFGWEYKGLHANLDAAYQQLLQYREALENPPLLVVCDTDRIIVHTNFINTVKRAHEIPLESIDDPESLRVLRAVFHNPERLRPESTPEGVTEEAAGRVAELADHLRERGVDAREAAHFLMKIIFCLFAEDIGLLPGRLMMRILTDYRREPEEFDVVIGDLFRAMASGGRVGIERIEHFNGGLFDDDATVPLTRGELSALAEVAQLDWSSIEPAIFGTLFERSLDPSRRSQLGAHYTSRTDINDIIEPVLMQPLREEWAEVRERCDKLAEEAEAAKTARTRNARQKKLQAEVETFIERIATVRVLDPACGSGNFLYVALAALNDLEKQVVQATGPWRVQVPFRRVDPSQLYGIEIDPYAAELAQLTVWIGYLQWMHFNGYLGQERPILKPLQNIQQRDAILEFDDDGNPREPEWPEADVIVGNPPFLGARRLRGELGDTYVDGLFGAYDGRVLRDADLCCYWLERGRSEIADGRAVRVGLLGTNSIPQPQNRPVIERILSVGGIFAAWSDRDWVLDGAAVRTCMIGFDDGSQRTLTLDGAPVVAINADLTSGLDITRARRLRANSRLAVQGDAKGGPFDVPGDLARQMLSAPNPVGRDNAHVVRPWWNGFDVTRRPRDMWIIDFPPEMGQDDAALYEQPFEYVREHILPDRRNHRKPECREQWWLHVQPRPSMRKALAGLTRYIVTTRHAKYRLFAWVRPEVLADSALIVFAREDDWFFGILHSRLHEVWALRMASTLEDRPRYIPRTCFHTFPFPRPTDDQRAAIAEAAKRLYEVRQSALDNDSKLTLTKLYNKRPTWLDNLHRDLDGAVFAAYGWEPDIGDDELLERLLELNLKYAAEEDEGIVTPP